MKRQSKTLPGLRRITHKKRPTGIDRPPQSWRVNHDTVSADLVKELRHAAYSPHSVPAMLFLEAADHIAMKAKTPKPSVAARKTKQALRVLLNTVSEERRNLEFHLTDDKNNLVAVLRGCIGRLEWAIKAARSDLASLGVSADKMQ